MATSQRREGSHVSFQLDTPQAHDNNASIMNSTRVIRPSSSRLPTPTFKRPQERTDLRPSTSSTVVRNMFPAVPPPNAAAGQEPTPRTSYTISRHNVTQGKNSLTRFAQRNSGLINTRRQSMSLESMLATPGLDSTIRSHVTPRGSARRRDTTLSGPSTPAVGPTIIVSNDKRHIADMAQYVFAFLEQLKCPALSPQTSGAQKSKSKAQELTWKDFVVPKIAVATYIGIIKFLVSQFISADVFSKNDKADLEIMKILEVLKLMQYPATVSKSNLKTPTVLHVWPSSLTLLTWLCLRTEALLTPPPERPTNNVQKFPDAAIKSALSLFHLHRKGKVTPDLIDAECQRFKQGLRDVQGTNPESKEELLQEKETLTAQLNDLKNEEDPVEELLNQIRDEEENQEVLKEKAAKAEEETKKYEYCDILIGRKEGIQLEVDGETAHLERLQEKLASQPFDKAEAEEMKMEIERLKNQLDAARHVNANLEKDKLNAAEKLDESQKKFYELCKNFAIVERYNEMLRVLKLDKYSIEPNPFSPKEMAEWLKATSNALYRIDLRICNMKVEISKGSEARQMESQMLRHKINKLQQKQDDWEQKLKSVRKYYEFLGKNHEEKLAAAQLELEESKFFLDHEEETLQKLVEENEKMYKEMDFYKERIYKGVAEDLEWKVKFEEGMAKYLLRVKNVEKFLCDMVTKAAKSQQEFYKTQYGINIFENLELVQDPE